MKSFIIATSIGAMCIAPAHAYSLSSFHSRDKAVIAGMEVLCDQTVADFRALNKPVPDGIRKECGL